MTGERFEYLVVPRVWESAAGHDPHKLVLQGQSGDSRRRGLVTVTLSTDDASPMDAMVATRQRVRVTFEVVGDEELPQGGPAVPLDWAGRPVPMGPSE